MRATARSRPARARRTVQYDQFENRGPIVVFLLIDSHGARLEILRSSQKPAARSDALGARQTDIETNSTTAVVDQKNNNGDLGSTASFRMYESNFLRYLSNLARYVMFATIEVPK